MPSTFTPKVVSEVLLDVGYITSGGLTEPAWMGSARVGQLPQPLLKVPVAVTLLDVEYVPSGGVKTTYSGARIYAFPFAGFPFPISGALLNSTYHPTGELNVEGEAQVTQLIGPFTPLPISTTLLQVEIEGQGGAWSNGGALWEAANYPVGTVVGGVLASGRGAIEYLFAPREFISDNIVIDFGEGGGGFGGADGSTRSSMSLSIGVSSTSGASVQDGSQITSGGAQPPVDLSGFRTSTDLMWGSGGTQSSGSVTYLGGTVTYVGTPKSILGGPGPPFTITLDIFGEIASAGGGSTMGLLDSTFPGLGGWFGTEGGLNISIGGLGSLGGSYDLSQFITVNDHTTGIPGGFFNGAPAPGAGSAVLSNLGLHANLLPMMSSLGGYVDYNSVNAQLKPLTSTIQAITGAIGTISAQLKPLTCSIYAMNTGTINATLTRLSNAFTVAGIISARLTRISSAINVGEASNAQLQIMVVNTHTTAISTYEDYPFNSYCEIGGVYFAASTTGLHQIDAGSTDAGQPISAGIGTGIMNFGDSLQKRMYDSFATMRSIGGISMIVTVDAGARHPPKTISMVPRAVTTGLVKYRGIMPKGLRGEAWQFELINVAGSPFDFNGLSILDVPASRHI